MMTSIRAEIVSLQSVPRKDAEFSDTRPMILVVDDETLVADTLSAILRHAGYRTTTAYNAERALELAADVHPALLISDVAMPDKNGVELAMQLLETQPDCKVLLFSGHATSSDLNPAAEAGYNFRLLAKPVHPTEMLRHIRYSLNICEPFTMPARRADVVSILRCA